MNMLIRMRTEVDSLLAKAIDPFESAGSVVTSLREKVQSFLRDISPRERRYFHRELTYQLSQNRTLHYIFQPYRGKDTHKGLPNAFHIESNTPIHKRYFETFEVCSQEKDTIEKLVGGTHWRDIASPHVSNRTLACACELYPLSTLLWLNKTYPKAIEPHFIARFAILLVCGLNASDIEQFTLPIITKHVPEQLIHSFLTLVHRVSRVNQFYYFRKYAKDFIMPLGSIDKELRRLKNIHTFLIVGEQ